MRSIHILIILIIILMGAGAPEARQAEPDMDREAIEAELREARQEMHEAARRLAELSAMLNEPAISETIHRAFRQARGPRLGIAITASEEPAGVRVRDVFEDSPAGAAGLQVGDVIIAVDGHSLADDDASTRALGQAIREHDGEAPLRLEIIRNGERMTVEAELPEAPPAPRHPHVPMDPERLHEGMRGVPVPPDAEAIRARVRQTIGRLGILGPVRLTPMNEGLATYFDTGEGLLVLSVPEEMDSQLRAGDVILSINGQSVHEIHDAIRLVRQGSRGEGGDPVELEILRKGERQTLSIEQGDSPLALLHHH